MELKLRIVLLLLFVLCIVKGYPIVYTHTQSIDDFEFLQREDGTTAILPSAMLSSNFSFPSKDTVPALPCCYVNVLLPFGETFSSLQYIIEEQSEIPNVRKIDRAPSVVPISTTTSSQDSLLNDDVLSHSIYPDSIVRVIGLHHSMSYHYVSLQICPFIYITDSCLSLIKSLRISILTQEEEVSTLSSHHRNIEPLIKIVVNPENALMDDTLTSVSPQDIDDVDYLIITCDSLRSAFSPLVQWKNMKGIRTKIVSVEDIDGEYSDASIQIKIKHCIHDYFQNNNLKYVLLGGDDSIVPVMGCYAIVNDKLDSSIPADKFYACFDGAFDWDANGNGVKGEISDNVNLLQQIFLSRLPVQTAQHVHNYIQKLLIYEQSPSQSYVQKFLLSGTKLWNYKPSGKSDAEEKSEKFYNENIAPYWGGCLYRFFDTDSDFGGPDYDLTEELLNSQLNNGYHFIHYASHGAQTSLSAEIGDYTVDGVRELHNVTTPFLFTTMACETNHFDNGNSECLSEAFIRHSQGGAIGYLGSSRSGWGYRNSDRYTTLGSSFKYNASFFRNLFENNIFHFAEIVSVAKNAYIAEASDNSAMRWLQYSLNPLGDAEMPIYTVNPIPFENISIVRRNDTVIVSTDSIMANIAVTSGFGEEYFSVLEDVSQGIFTGVPSEYDVVVTKHNYIPYIYQNPVYVQNQIIQGIQNIQAESIVVGSHVCSTLPQGDVYVPSGGNLKLQYSNRVVLDAGTHIELGGELLIKKIP